MNGKRLSMGCGHFRAQNSLVFPRTQDALSGASFLRKKQLVAAALALALAAALSRADNNWDGDNPFGNFSYNDNWFGNNQPGWGFGSGNLVFNFRNNSSQTSLYFDYGG